MGIAKETVEYVANLARIDLTDKELEKLSGQLKGILDFIAKLNKIELKDTNPTSHILDIKNVLREDKPGGSLPAEKALDNAPQKESNFFIVPKVIE